MANSRRIGKKSLGFRTGEDAEKDTKEMIEMSLRENDLLCRSEEENGRIKLMVLPEDEGRARQIVREIVEGAPLG